MVQACQDCARLPYTLVLNNSRFLQGWLAEYVAKAKDVAGVKEGPNGSPEAAPVAPAAEAPAAEKRLVLYGRTQASPGLTGFFRTARTEPLGERLRLVCDATHPGSGPEGTWSLDQMPSDGAAHHITLVHMTALRDGNHASTAQRSRPT